MEDFRIKLKKNHIYLGRRITQKETEILKKIKVELDTQYFRPKL